MTKKLLELISMAAVLMGLAAGCAVKEELAPVSSDLIPVMIDGAIDQISTKATGEGFVAGDALGLYAVNMLSDNTVAGTLADKGNQVDNAKYVFDGTKWSALTASYYKDVNTHVDIYAYYPYQGSVSSTSALNFEVQQDQSKLGENGQLGGYEASDFLWCKVADVTPSEAKVKLRLAHRMAGVQVKLIAGSGFDEEEFESMGKSVLATSTTRKATINFATGEVSPVGAAQNTGIVMAVQADDSFRAVLVPQSVAAGTKLFAITIDGVAYGFSVGSNVAYTAGKLTSFDITVNKKTPSGDYEFVLSDTQITDWTEDLNTHGGEARQYYVVNVTTPGTLGDLIAAAGKNPAKIRNLKVSGQVNGADFYFMRDNMDILESINMKEAKIVAGTASGSNMNDNEADVIPNYAFYQKKSLVNFVFPELVKEIGFCAFSATTLSGPVILPDDVTIIGNYAFEMTNIANIQFSRKLETIGVRAFAQCKAVTGDLLIPEGVTSIGEYAFFQCGNFSGKLTLPEKIERISAGTFMATGSFKGDLVIPENVKTIEGNAFELTTFTGGLNLCNVQEIGQSAFSGCGFQGELVIPEGVIEIPQTAFYGNPFHGAGNKFSKIVLPSSLRVIGDQAFRWNSRISEPIVFPEGFVTIQSDAFASCSNLTAISLPSTIQTIASNAFAECFYISSITCDAVEPPSIGSGAFDGVAKDNFTVGVPAQSVKRYQAEIGWSDFKRIAAHYDFSLSRPRMRALNGGISRTYILRAPANFDWSVDATSLPEWVTVSPMSGTGKTDVTITVADMPRTDDTFEVNEGSFNSPSYNNYKGRSGQVTFRLDEKGSSFTFDVEQYDYEYPDGYVQTLQTASKGPGIDIVFTGDAYDAKDIAKGIFADNASKGYEYLFDVEPYKTYKEYFNVYAVTAMSDESGVGTVNTVKDSKFGAVFTQNRIRCEKPDDAFAWAKKANPSMDLTKSLVILLMNTSTYEGICYMYGDGSALACCPVSTDAYPYDFRGIVQHEAGGHGFGKLADEYIYHNAYIQNCDCKDGCDHPQGDDDTHSSYGFYKSKGWYKNLSMNGDMKQVPWAHLIYHSQYSDYVDMYEGGYMHTRGIYRSEATSCMNNNIPYFSAISRQAIVERIKDYAGEEFTLADFYAKDDDSFGTITKAGLYVDRTFGVDPDFHKDACHGPVYMGEHPNVK
ncbi:MAG: leucine-rich repeat protein [Bacteroidales bacterium]|nr:leucine-rich repeat protein [Bacteroidales bacterium]